MAAARGLAEAQGRPLGAIPNGADRSRGRSCPHHDRPDSAERERAEPPTRPAPSTEPEQTPSARRPSSRDRDTRSRAPTTEQPTTAAPPPRRLYRSRDDRVIAGVCGGIARYFNIDPVLVRVGAVALVFLGGAGLLAYIAAVLLIPNEGEGGQPPEAPNRGMAITGVVLLVVAIGVVLPFHGCLGAKLGARAARVPRPCGPLRLAAGFRSAA